MILKYETKGKFYESDNLDTCSMNTLLKHSYKHATVCWTIAQTLMFFIKYHFHSFREPYETFTDLYLLTDWLCLWLTTKFNDFCFELQGKGKTLTWFDWSVSKLNQRSGWHRFQEFHIIFSSLSWKDKKEAKY